MSALEIIARSITYGSVHPTVVLNTLIEAENAGGHEALKNLHQHLKISVRIMNNHPRVQLAERWLAALELYLQEYHTIPASRLKSSWLRQLAEYPKKLTRGSAITPTRALQL